MSQRLRIAVGIVLLLATALPVIAGQFGRYFLPPPTAVEPDSRFAFTRIRYGTRVGRNGGWEHDYPQADRSFSAILDYISHTRVHLNESNILDLDDPRIFQNPVIYMSEPGFRTSDESEATSLRKYLNDALNAQELVVTPAYTQWIDLRHDDRIVSASLAAVPIDSIRFQARRTEARPIASVRCPSRNEDPPHADMSRSCCVRRMSDWAVATPRSFPQRPAPGVARIEGVNDGPCLPSGVPGRLARSSARPRTVNSSIVRSA